jgi:Flp pilus assembly pilin Flp
MSIWNKVLVGLICVTCLGYFYLISRTLKTHQYWEELAQKFEKRIALVDKQNEQLIEGGTDKSDPAQAGIRQCRIDLARVLIHRGRIWVNCEPKVKVDPQQFTATATVTVENINPNDIVANTILHVFEEANIQKKGRYLGQFKVTAVDGKAKTVTLVPTMPLSPRQLDHISKAQKPWELYETLPHDEHEIFASLTEKEIESMLPAETRRDYLNDGKDKFERKLRDYQVLMTIYNVRCILTIDEIDAAQRDLKLVEDALAQAKQQEEAAKRDVAEAKVDAAKYTRERDAVVTYLKTLQQDVETVKTAISKLIENNKAMAGQIAKLQLDAAQQIDQRTRAMARANTGG